MHTWTETLQRETDLDVAARSWDHVTVTHGLGSGRISARSAALAVGGVAVAVAVVAALGLGGVLSASDAAAGGSSGSSGTPTVAVHSRFGPVVHADPTSHSRLGPVVQHGALPRHWKS